MSVNWWLRAVSMHIWVWVKVYEWKWLFWREPENTLDITSTECCLTICLVSLTRHVSPHGGHVCKHSSYESKNAVCMTAHVFVVSLKCCLCQCTRHSKCYLASGKVFLPSPVNRRGSHYYFYIFILGRMTLLGESTNSAWCIILMDDPSWWVYWNPWLDYFGEMTLLGESTKLSWA